MSKLLPSPSRLLLGGDLALHLRISSFTDIFSRIACIPMITVPLSRKLRYFGRESPKCHVLALVKVITMFQPHQTCAFNCSPQDNRNHVMILTVCFVGVRNKSKLNRSLMDDLFRSAHCSLMSCRLDPYLEMRLPGRNNMLGGLR